ncbi:MAG: hypothetical protein Q9202_001743 [Teloschistes flavicans]
MLAAMVIARLREVWSLVLNQDKSDIKDNDNFFEINRDSVAAAQEAKLNLLPDTVLHPAILADMAAHTIALKEDEMIAGLAELDVDLVQDCASECSDSADMIEGAYRCPAPQFYFLRKHLAAEEARTLVERLVLIKKDIKWNTATALNAYVQKVTIKRSAFGDPLTRMNGLGNFSSLTAMNALLIRKRFAAQPARPSFKPYTEFTLAISEEAIAWWKQYLLGARLECSFTAIRPGYTPVMKASLDRTLLGPQAPRESFAVFNLAHAAFSLALFELSNRPDEVAFKSIRMGRQIPVKGIENIMGQIFSIVILRLRMHVVGFDEGLGVAGYGDRQIPR